LHPKQSQTHELIRCVNDDYQLSNYNFHVTSKLVERARGPERSRIERFPALDAIPNIRHAFIVRIPDIDVSHDKAEVLKRLDAAHCEARREVGMGDWPLLTAQQIHGNKIAVVDQ